jgi:hypothetical protein
MARRVIAYSQLIKREPNVRLCPGPLTPKTGDTYSRTCFGGSIAIVAQTCPLDRPLPHRAFGDATSHPTECLDASTSTPSSSQCRLRSTSRGGRPTVVATLVQAGAWVVCTLAALLTARNRHIMQHRQWMVRSYAMTFTFMTMRLLNPWPRFWNLSDSGFVITIIPVTFLSMFVPDIAFSWRESPHVAFSVEI